MPKPINPETQRKIIQIISHDDDLFGLSEDGNLFILLDTSEWEHIIDSPYLED